VSRLGRVRAETVAGWHGFLRRRTAVFFTFFFPAILILIFGALVGARPAGGGLFAEPPGYYVPGYLAVVVLFTPLSRLGAEIARSRDARRFEKLATTPLSRGEWLLAQTLVNVAIVGLACLLVLVLVTVATDATLRVGPALAWLVPLVALGVALFCGIGAVIGRLADSQDGAIAASNTIALPLLFLSETFVPPALLPAWFRPAIAASPLTYFARGVRAATYGGDPVGSTVAVLAALAAVAFAAGALAVPRTE